MDWAFGSSYLDRSYGWRAVAILAEIGRASLDALRTCFTIEPRHPDSTGQ
jgi:hypothetical protein